MHRWPVVAILVGVALVTSCVSTTVTVRPETVPSAANAPAASFWDAVNAFEFERATQLAANDAERDLAFSIEAAHMGNVDDAVAAARRSWQSAPDAAHKQRAREWLENLLMSQARWKEVLGVYGQDPTPIEPTKDLRPLASVYEAAQKEEYRFVDGDNTLPITMVAGGLPVAEVEINGQRKKLVIDTGTGITIVSTDVARDAGVAVGRDSHLARTATTRTVAIRGAVIDQLRLGSLVIRNHPAAVIESSALRIRLMGLVTVFKIDGILGWNALRQMTVRIRYRDKTLHVSAPHKEPIGAERNLFGIAEPLVSLTDDRGQRLIFKLDTGATFSSLDERILTKIDRTGARRKKIAAFSAGGAERYDAAVIPALTLRVSGYSLEFKNLKTHPSPKQSTRDGRLGGDIARDGSMTIDALNGRFALERASKAD